MKVESTYVHWRCFDVEKTALKESIVSYCTPESCSKTKKNKFSSIKHVFLLYKNIIKLLFHLQSNDRTG